MALVLETVAKQLEDSGIVAPGKLQNFMPPKANPKSAEDLLRELYKQNLLTKFQAQQVGAGKVRALILGNYTLLDRIGAGGMGQVFKAEHRRMHRLVAIKMLPPALTKDAESIARFQREVTAAARLRHPNIVAADDADEANGAHFLVMEYVEGSDLSALVKKNGPFPFAKAANYILQAAKGLEFAHGEGVIHRDIKPANLLLDKRGAVKILDMGLARIETAGGAGGAAAELTSSGMVMGTVDYMAPEQALNSKHADARADIYSLGCSLYFLIAGKPTYDGDTMVAKLLAHQGQPIPSLKEVQPNVPDELESIYKKMIAKTVTDRYQSMRDVVADLERFCGGQSTSISAPQSSIGTNPGLEQTTAFSSSVLSNQLSPSSFQPVVTRITKPAKTKVDQKKLIAVGMGAILVLLLIVAGIVVTLKTPDGTLIVEVDQPDATVQILDAEGKIEIDRKGGSGKFTIGVDPGKHRLKIEKDGFVVYSKTFEMESGGKKTISAKLEAVDGPPIAAPTSNSALAFTTPAFALWLKEVTAMPAEKKIDAVAKKLQELNPGFDGKVDGATQNNVVTSLKFFSNEITNISPVCALSGLKVLGCDANQRQGKFADLSPLQGMKLTELVLTGTGVSDLSPLSGMPLTWLSVSKTNVSDLSPLRGMPLTYLNADSTQVSDLSSLQNCKQLKSLTVVGTKVTPATVAALQAALPNCDIKLTYAAKSIAPPSSQPAPLQGIGTAPPLAKAPFDSATAKQHQQAWAKYLGTTVETTNSVGAKMILIPPGEFLMGSSEAQIEAALKVAQEFKADRSTKDRIEKSEGPQHRVVIATPFEVGATEVTVGQFRKFVDATKYLTEAEKYGFGNSGATTPDNKVTSEDRNRFWQTPGYPVTDESPVSQITWNDACAYCNWLSEQEKLKPCYRKHAEAGWTLLGDLVTPGPSPANGEGGFGFRLPTEAEWEYACRAGTISQFSFGDDHRRLSEFGWYNKNAGNQAMAVGMKGANPFGLYDIHGNLYEWCQDYWEEQWYSIHSTKNQGSSAGPSAGSSRVIRGGSYPYHVAHCRSASRFFSTPSSRYFNAGFRVVRVLNAPAKTMEAAMLPTKNDVAKGVSSPPRSTPPLDTATAKRHQHAWAKYLSTTVETTNSVGAKMILIPPGEFLMGSTDAQVEAALKVAEEIKTDRGTIARIQSSERPQHRVVITKPFLIGATEVTYGQFRQFVDATQYQTDAEKFGLGDSGAKAVTPTDTDRQKQLKWRTPGFAVNDNFPATQITWNDACAYCNWLSEQDQRLPNYQPDGKGGWIVTAKGNGYRLPTEAEWEYACRAGTTTHYSFGDDYKALLDYGWFQKNNPGHAQVVGLKKPNPFGLYDMYGNMIEWCQDFYDEKWYEKISANSPEDPTGPPTGSHRVQRGSYYSHFATNCRSAYRFGYSPIDRSTYSGFRVVRALDAPAPSSAAISKSPTDPAFDAWMKTVAALPAQQQVEAVAKKLQELNPGFDGKVTPTIQNGVVTNFSFLPDDMTDLSPVRALTGLKGLNCHARRGNQPSDLSPLQGMPLKELNCTGMWVADLSPLAGMPLEWLSVSNTKVADLSPLRGMPLKFLNVDTTPVTDLSPLHDCKQLESLQFVNTKVPPASVAALQEALPNCKIKWNGFPKP